jgi:hypothetical protein
MFGDGIRKAQPLANYFCSKQLKIKTPGVFSPGSERIIALPSDSNARSFHLSTGHRQSW